MQNTNQPTQKKFNLTAYEIGVLFQGILKVFNARSPEILKGVRSSAPWEAVLDSVQTAQLDTLKEVTKNGELEGLLVEYMEQISTKNN